MARLRLLKTESGLEWRAFGELHENWQASSQSAAVSQTFDFLWASNRVRSIWPLVDFNTILIK